MKHIGALLGSATFFVFAASSVSAVTVLPTYTYNFQGACAANDCTGFGVGLLTLNTSSTTISASNFVGFSYMSNLVNFTIYGNTNGAMASGSLTALPGPDYTLFSDNSYTFTSSSSGGWSVGRTILISAGSDEDRGATSIWAAGPAAVAAVPEPATWAMMLAGFAMIGMAMRSRNRTGVRFA